MPKVTDQIKQNFLSALDKLESKTSQVKFAIKQKLDVLEPVCITPYMGFASDSYVYMKGRVLENEKITKPSEMDDITEQWLNMWKRMESDEIPGAKLKAWFDDQELDIEADEEGYFQVEIHADKTLDFDKIKPEIKLELQNQYTDKDEKEAVGHLLIPGSDAEFGVISDIDDTVLLSKVNDTFGKLRLMLTKNATERSPFPGIGAFLRALQKGKDGKGKNPIFYVSGSEWNLYDLLMCFLTSHNIPKGPLLLRDRGTAWDRGEYATSKEEYKLEKIRHILDTYPKLKFICIGDSGQHDPESYRSIVQEYPDRIIGIYVHDVSPDKRDKEVKEIAHKVKSKGTEMVLAAETLEAAKHAAKMGWINENQLDEIEQACKEDQQP